jgi:hypothetical protein
MWNARFPYVIAISRRVPDMSAARFQEDAERCDRLAEIMLAPAQRDAYVEMAKMWRKLANETGAHLQRVAAWERRNGLKPSVTTVDPSDHATETESESIARAR